MCYSVEDLVCYVLYVDMTYLKIHNKAVNIAVLKGAFTLTRVRVPVSKCRLS